jgi:DNA polymerase-4
VHEARGRPVEKGLAAKTIGIKLRFDDFKIATRALSLPAHTLDGREIRRAAGQCLKRVDLARRLRLLGVRASALRKVSELVAGVATPAPPRAREPNVPYDLVLPLFDAPPGPT